MIVEIPDIWSNIWPTVTYAFCAWVRPFAEWFPWVTKRKSVANRFKINKIMLFVASKSLIYSYIRLILGHSWTAPIHYLNQCWNIVNWTLRNKLHWNFNRNSNIFIQENALEDVVCEMASILSRPQCVKRFGSGWVLQQWFTVKSNYTSILIDHRFPKPHPQSWEGCVITHHRSMHVLLYFGVNQPRHRIYQTKIDMNMARHITLKNNMQ